MNYFTKIFELRLQPFKQVWEIQTCFDKCKKVHAYFKLVNQFMSKPLTTQAPTNDKYSLNIQEVKKFLNLWLLAISLMLDKLFNPYLGVPDTSTKTLA